MLGTSLLPVLRDKEHTILATDIENIDDNIGLLDVRALGDMLETASKFRPEILLHLAAETNLEVCEERVDYAYAENFMGTQNACVVCRKLDIPLAYVSTAGVFNGLKSEPYTEFDTPNPVNIYGKTKLEGERIIRETCPNHYIVRAGWMVGGGERDKKFVSKIIGQIDAGVKVIHAVGDKLGTPTYAPAFSAHLERLIATGVHGTYHLACKGSGSRYDVAAEILRILGRDDIELKSVSSEFFKTEYFAPRPRSEEMSNMVLELRSMNEMPDWRDALGTYLEEHFKEYIV